jgi:acyl dehydratase
VGQAFAGSPSGIKPGYNTPVTLRRFMPENPDLLTFQDFTPGHFGTFGPRQVTRAEIIDFAREFDPQPMHLDEAAAQQSMLGGLAGSGWHTCALIMRMIYDGFLHRTASLGSPGVQETKWVAPLRPDEELMLDVSVSEARPSASRPGTGIVTFHMVLRGRDGIVAEMKPVLMIGGRDGAQAA